MSKNKITFTVAHDLGRYGGDLNMSISISADSTIQEVLEVFERMAVALTYTPDNIAKGYRDRLQELDELKQAAAIDDELDDEMTGEVLDEDYTEWRRRVEGGRGDSNGNERSGNWIPWKG